MNTYTVSLLFQITPLIALFYKYMRNIAHFDYIIKLDYISQ